MQGIDVQSELKKKEITIPGKVPPSLPQPTAVQRAAMNRHHHFNRSNSGPTSLLHKLGSGSLPNHSPQLRPSPHSQAGSPTTARSPPFGVQGGMNPPPPNFKNVPPPIRPAPGASLPSPSSGPGLQSIAPSPTTQPGSAGVARPNHWPSPYPTHMEQLGMVLVPC
jgi:hypothetical protein